MKHLKRAILFIAIAATTTSCIRENMSGCPAVLRLQFQYQGSGQQFDQQIGTDIELRRYNNQVLYSTESIPFNQINNNQQYPIQNNREGDITLTAWAVKQPSSRAQDQPLPIFVEGEHYSQTRLALPPSQTHPTKHRPIMADVFLGQDTYETTSNVADVRTIAMLDMLCKVDVVAHTASILHATPDQLRVELEGTHNQMSLDMNAAGEPAIVQMPFAYDTNTDKLSTPISGLLPSADNQTLGVTIYIDNQPLFRIDTKEKSSPGSRITIEIINMTTVHIYIDGWRVRTTTIERL